jgi:Peptidase family M3
VWHPDVRFFKLSVKGQPKAYFYLDPYSRPEEKRGGAWMAEVRHGTRFRLSGFKVLVHAWGVWGCGMHVLSKRRQHLRDSALGVRRRTLCLLQVCGQSKLFAPAGSKVRLPIAHMVSHTPRVVSSRAMHGLRQASRPQRCDRWAHSCLRHLPALVPPC